METPEDMLEVLVKSAKSFDFGAAENASPEDAERRLKVIKHYIRVVFRTRNVNSAMKIFLNLCGIEPEVPGSVVGGYDFVLSLLKSSHACIGRDCVRDHKKVSASHPGHDAIVASGKTKTSVKQPKVTVKKKKVKEKKLDAYPSYMI